MPKIIKIIISILIAISIVFNPVCSVFGLVSFALSSSGTGIGLGIDIGNLFIGAWESADNIDWRDGVAIPIEEKWNDFSSHSSNKQSSAHSLIEKYVNNGTIIDGSVDFLNYNYVYDEAKDVYTISSVSVGDTSSLTSNEIEVANDIANHLNGYIGKYGNISLYSGNYTAFEYQQLKEYITDQELKEAYNLIYDTGAGLIIDGVPTYNFDFTSDTPYWRIPSSQVQSSLISDDGFLYGLPVHSSLFNDVGRFKTPSAAYQFYKGLFPNCTPDSFAGDDVNGYYAQNWYLYSNGTSLAFFYNDDVYYYEIQKYLNGYTAENSGFTVWYNYDLSAILSGAKNIKGEILGDIATVNSDFSVSLCSNKGSVVASSMPISTVNYEDFEQTTGGGTVEIPLTPVEQVVAEALKLGLLTDDSMLTIGEDGVITAADGIDLASIERLLEEIKTGQLDFASFEEYLQLISQLIANGNLTEAEQTTLLANVEAATKAQTKSIDEIKTAVKSISEAMTIDSDFEIENTLTLPNVEEITVTQGGMPEAELLIKEAFPVVEQSKLLLTNLFAAADDTDEPPNFTFYWDSNKDGEDERYVLFDLSFMEYTLSNANLEDKNRFKNPMTVREFVQSLILLIVYSLFAIKALKKIPALFGMGESAENVRTALIDDWVKFGGEPEDRHFLRF